MRKLFFTLLLAFWLPAATSHALQDSVDRHLYAYHIGEQVAVGWDHDGGAESFELMLYHYEQGEQLQVVGMVNVPGTARQFTFNAPRWGHYEVWVRACKSTADPQCSDWIKSIESTNAQVDGNPRAWWLYAFPAPVTQGGIQ